MGLAKAHAHNMIHRDIKPDNIWLEEKTDRAKILDFGLVSAAADDEGLTHSGTVLGTPKYMAPEQALAHPFDHRADIFSLGSMLYHCAAGTPPFRWEQLYVDVNRSRSSAAGSIAQCCTGPSR